MNDYGYLVYDSDIEAANANVFANEFFAKQSQAENIILHHGITPRGYRNWASFEQGEFDFEKPIYTGNAWDLIPFTTMQVSNEDGLFEDEEQHEFDFVFYMKLTEAYSGDGFTLVTDYDEYELEIHFFDNFGEHDYNFVKTKDMQDEFFYCPYESLDTDYFVTFAMKIPPFHFGKVLAVGFGGTRIITDENFAEEPQFDHYFSLMSDELPLDTLTLKIYSDNNFKPVSGNKITNYFTGQEFYVQTVEYNADQTFTVNCYDALVKRDISFSGMMRSNTAVKNTAVMEALLGDLSYSFDSTTDGFNTLTWAGTVTDERTCREALRILLQGFTMALRKMGEQFIIISPFNTTYTPRVLNESNIVSVEVEKLEPYTRAHFSKHRFTVDKTNGLQEAYRDFVELYNQQSDNIETLSFGEPYNSVLVYYVSAQSGDTETLTPVNPNNFVVTQTGAYLIKAKNLSYTQEIVVKGYPYKTSYTSIDYKPDVSSQFKENELMISDCTVALNVSNSAYKRRLEFYAKFDTVITLQSIKNYGAGEKVTVDIDEKTFEGFITHKTDRMNGLYEYEILGYEVIDNVA